MSGLRRIMLLAVLWSSLACWGCQGYSPVDPQALQARALERLRSDVNSADPLLMMRALEAVVDLRLANGPQIAERYISTSEPLLQFAGVMGLIELPSSSAQARLSELASSSDRSVGLAAIGALHRLGRTEHSQELMIALDDPDPQLRANALTILGRLGDDSAIPQIRKMLAKEQTERVSLQAAEALVLLGDEKILPKVQLWQYSTNWQERIFAAQVMGQVKEGHDFTPDLTQKLEDPNQMVQLQAARSLGQLANSEGFELAQKYIFPSGKLKRMIGQDMGLSPADPRLLEVISQMRSLAALALGDIGRWQAAEQLNRALDDSDPQLALAAAQASLRLLIKTGRGDLQTIEASGP